MTTSPTLNTTWLVSVLDGLGGTGDEVADTLRKAGARGTPKDIWSDPVAVYVGRHALDLVPPGTEIEVAVTAEEVVVSIPATPPGTHDTREVAATTPSPVEDFLDRFDADEDYGDLAEALCA
jgi:hypothetical protein